MQGLAVALVTCLVAAPLAWGQREWGQPTQLPAGLLARRADLENLLRTGQGALERRDWKLAIDSLQRIIDDEVGALLPAGSETDTYLVRESARRRATALLAEMPAEGMRAYRLLNDGKAEALWMQATEKGDESALRTLVDRYLITTRGGRAADLLAAILIDRGLPADALELLDRLEAWCPAGDVAGAEIGRKRAVCWLMLDDSSRAMGSLADSANATRADAATLEILELVNGGWQATPERALEGGGESWPRAGGDLWRSGRMPAVSPELRENLPWRYPLPADDPDWWDREYLPYRDVERGLPASLPVVADGRVFVKRVNQIVAFDLESLEPLWQSDPPPETSSAPQFRTRRLANRNERYVDRFNLRERLLHDYVGNLVAVAGERLFEIEREGRGPNRPAGSDRVVIDQVRDEMAWQGSRLIARHAARGDVLWERGRTTQPEDPLGDVFFLSAPLGIPARGSDGAAELWTVYARRNDVMLGVLDGRDGSLMRELLLCSVDAREINDLLHEAVYPASDTQTLYVTMSAGLVLAVDIASFSLRWATTYPRTVHVSGTAPTNWLCGPAVISGRLILAAPPDSDHLIALDRSSGAMVWNYPRPAPIYYVLAADDRYAWLGGDGFTCLNLANGSEAWRAFDGATVDVTGRAALAGGSIHIPTAEGLTTLNAETGETTSQVPVPTDQLALGNLLCLASALFSVDTNEVRKFPDLTMSYPRQLAAYAADPTNEQAAVRLAWMELLRDQPQETIEALAPLRTRGPGRYRTEISRLWIDALLRLANQPETADTRAVELLIEAQSLTESDLDRLRTSLALSSRLRKLGRAGEAYLRLWRLGLTSAGEGYVTIEPKLRNRARMVIAEVLARFERGLTARELAVIQAETQQALAEALAASTNESTSVEGRRDLQALAELDDAGGAGQAALIALGRMERASGRIERSEQYLREAIRRDRAASVTAQALRDLAEQYVGEHQRLSWEAWQLLAELEHRFAAVALPSEQGDDTTIAGEVERLRRQIDRAEAERGAAYCLPGRFQLVPQPTNARFDLLNADALFDYASERSEASGRFALLYDQPNRVNAVRPGNASVVWSTALQLPGTLPAEESEEEQPGGWGELHAVAHCDGQTAVVNGPDGLFGIGLLTGRRLWGVAYEEPYTADRMSLRNRLVAVDRGRLVCAPRRGVLTCASVLDGGEVRWERILTDERIDSVLIKDEYCVTLDNPRERATVYDAANGRRIAMLNFSQPKGAAPPIPLVYEGGHLTGPVDERTVACFSVRTGRENWRHALPQEIYWTFNPGEGYVGICGAEGHLHLVDILSGDVALSAQLPEMQSGYAEGVIRDGALVVMAAAVSHRGYDPAIVSLDIESGAVRWRRTGIGATGGSQFAQWKLLQTAREVMPVFRRGAVDSDNSFYRDAGQVVVEVVDLRTGETVGPSVATGLTVTDQERLTGEFGLWPGHLLVGTHRGLLTLPTTNERPARGALPAEEDIPQ